MTRPNTEAIDKVGGIENYRDWWGEQAPTVGLDASEPSSRKRLTDFRKLSPNRDTLRVVVGVIDHFGYWDEIATRVLAGPPGMIERFLKGLEALCDEVEKEAMEGPQGVAEMS